MICRLRHCCHSFFACVGSLGDREEVYGVDHNEEAPRKSPQYGTCLDSVRWESTCSSTSNFIFLLTTHHFPLQHPATHMAKHEHQGFINTGVPSTLRTLSKILPPIVGGRRLMEVLRSSCLQKGPLSLRKQGSEFWRRNQSWCHWYVPFVLEDLLAPIPSLPIPMLHFVMYVRIMFFCTLRLAAIDELSIPRKIIFFCCDYNRATAALTKNSMNTKHFWVLMALWSKLWILTFFYF
jgi:hypothetical protein